MICFSIYVSILFLFLLWRINSLAVVVDDLTDTVKYLEDVIDKE